MAVEAEAPDDTGTAEGEPCTRLPGVGGSTFGGTTDPSEESTWAIQVDGRAAANAAADCLRTFASEVSVTPRRRGHSCQSAT